MNKDHYERDNKESGQCLDQGDEIRTSSEQNDNKEEIDIEYHVVLCDISKNYRYRDNFSKSYRISISII